MIKATHIISYPHQTGKVFSEIYGESVAPRSILFESINFRSNRRKRHSNPRRKGREKKEKEVEKHDQTRTVVSAVMLIWYMKTGRLSRVPIGNCDQKVVASGLHRQSRFVSIQIEIPKIFPLLFRFSLEFFRELQRAIF